MMDMSRNDLISMLECHMNDRMCDMKGCKFYKGEEGKPCASCAAENALGYINILEHQIDLMEGKGGSAMMFDLRETVNLMCSDDYNMRMKAEYLQTKIRYEKLKAFNNKIEAARRTEYSPDKRVGAPAHDCPDDLLLQQQKAMGEYLHILEVRAVIEGVEL